MYLHEFKEAAAEALREADAYERAGRGALARSIRAAVEAERREVSAREGAVERSAAEALEPVGSLLAARDG
jgi:hypothetical protein